MLADCGQKSPDVGLQVALLSQAVQRNERRDVVAADPNVWLQVELQVVGVQIYTLVLGRQREAHAFPSVCCDGVIPTWRHQQIKSANK